MLCLLLHGWLHLSGTVSISNVLRIHFHWILAIIITILGSHDGKFIECLLKVRVFIFSIAVISRSGYSVFPFVNR